MSNPVMRCKLVCQQIQKLGGVPGCEDQAKVRFGAVWEPSTGTPLSENAVFGKYTPYAEFIASIHNQSVIDSLEVGAEYYVDFTKK